MGQDKAFREDLTQRKDPLADSMLQAKPQADVGTSAVRESNNWQKLDAKKEAGDKTAAAGGADNHLTPEQEETNRVVHSTMLPRFAALFQDQALHHDAAMAAAAAIPCATFYLPGDQAAIAEGQAWVQAHGEYTVALGKITEARAWIRKAQEGDTSRQWIDGARVVLGLPTKDDHKDDPTWATWLATLTKAPDARSHLARAQSLLDDKAGNRDVFGLMWRVLGEVSATTELKSGQLVGTEQDQAKLLLETLERVEGWDKSHNGIDRAGFLYGTAISMCEEAIGPLRQAVERGGGADLDADSANRAQLHAALEKARSALQPFGSKDPVEALSGALTGDRQNAKVAADVVSLIPGWIGIVGSFAIRELDTTLDFASGDLTGTQYALKTAANAADAALSKLVPGKATIARKAIQTFGEKLVIEFAKEGPVVYNECERRKLTPEQSWEEVQAMIARCVMNAFLESLAVTFHGGIEMHETKETLIEIYKGLVSFGQKLEIGPRVEEKLQPLKREIDKGEKPKSEP